MRKSPVAPNRNRDDMRTTRNSKKRTNSTSWKILYQTSLRTLGRPVCFLTFMHLSVKSWVIIGQCSVGEFEIVSALVRPFLAPTQVRSVSRVYVCVLKLGFGDEIERKVPHNRHGPYHRKKPIAIAAHTNPLPEGRYRIDSNSTIFGSWEAFVRLASLE